MEWTRATFEAQQFVGWTTFSDLAHAEVPRERGVYVVMTEPSDVTPAFLPESVGGQHKGSPLTVPVPALEAAWQPNAEVLYIGKANGARWLYDRLWSYTRQGHGHSAGHFGGRYLWQWPGSEQLIVGWRTTGELDPHDVEDALLSLHIAKYGARPFANMKDGYRFTPSGARELLRNWWST